MSDIRLALRFAARRPAVPMLVAGLLALSVGLAGGLWAVVDAVALRPLPYRDGHELVAVMERHPERGLMAVPAANFLDWIDRVPALVAVAGTGGLEASLVGRGAPVRVIGTKVTGQFFDVMGVAPALGRPFAAADFRADGRVVVIDDGIWERQFGRAANIVGTPVTIDGASYTVVGVMPREFKTIGNSRIWVPWIMTPEERMERRFHMVGVVARLRAPSSPADAQFELQAVYRQLAADHPDTTAQWTAQVIPLRELMLGDSRRALVVLGMAVAALLVVASINVVGLLAAWLRGRRQELLVRIALGASAGRLVRQVLTETMTWAIAGMAGGVLLAVVFVKLFGAVGLSPVFEYDFEPRIDLRVVAAMGALLAAVVIATTIIPAIVSGREARDLVPRRASTAGLRGQQLSMALQTALSLLLLSSGAALLAGFQQVSALASPDPPSSFGVDVSLAEARYRDEESQARFFERLLSALNGRQELEAVALASYVPPARIFGNVRFEIEGRATPTDLQTSLASGVSPELFRFLGIPLLRGRLLEDRDAAGTPHVGVISRSLARRYWPDDDPLGRRIVLVGESHSITIVGVVDDVRQPLSPDPRAESVLYLSFRQVPLYFMTVLVSPRGDPAPAFAAVREEVERLDAAQAVGAARPMDEIRKEWLVQPRMRTRIVSLFGLAALILTLVGLYARVSYAVTSRTREFAIRQAVGARPADVVRLLAGETLAVVAAGMAVGLMLLPAASTSIRAMVGGLPVFGIAPSVAMAGLFFLAAAASAYGPARRAGRTSPADALRAE